jgi:hypothetical protein
MVLHTNTCRQFFFLLVVLLSLCRNWLREERMCSTCSSIRWRREKSDALVRNIEKKTEQNDISDFICTFRNKKKKEQTKEWKVIRWHHSVILDDRHMNRSNDNSTMIFFSSKDIISKHLSICSFFQWSTIPSNNKKWFFQCLV